MRTYYLAAAIFGAIVPYIFFIDFFGEVGLDLPAFASALFANGAAGGFTADILITSGVFWAYMFSRKDGPKPWLYVVLNLTIGLSCALPAYLYSTMKAGHRVGSDHS